MVSVSGNGRSDDGSDDTIASPRLVEKAVLKGIGRFEAIPPVSIQVALTDAGPAQTFNLSRKWTVPRLVLELSSGRMALRNVAFLVADDDLAFEDVLIGLPILQHLQIDSRTLLERNRAVLDGTDCANVGNETKNNSNGVLRRLMVSRMQHVDKETHSDRRNQDGKNEQEGTIPLDSNRPREDYFELQQQKDPFPGPSLLDVL